MRWLSMMLQLGARELWSWRRYVFPSYLSSFKYLGILLWISHVPARRERRMIKLICRMPSCIDYELASLYVACTDYVLFCFYALWGLYELCILFFVWTMRFVWTMHSFVYMDYALRGLYICANSCASCNFMGKICKHVYFLGNSICKIVHLCVIYLIEYHT